MRGIRPIAIATIAAVAALVPAPARLDDETARGRQGTAAGGGTKPRAEVIFRSEREETADGSVLWSDVQGDLDADQAQRAGRPWSYLHESTLFEESAWSRSDDGLTVRYGYSVSRRPNPSPIRHKRGWTPPEVDPALAQELAEGDPTAVLPLTLDVRGVPAWDIPLQPVAHARSADDLTKAQESRRRALADRKAASEKRFVPIAQAVEALGGEIVARGGLGGWLSVRMPASAVAVLLERKDLRRVSLLRGRAVEHGGSIQLSRVRSDAYIDARQYLDAGYTGETGNPARHGFGDITVGVVEINQLEDAACFVYDGTECSGETRLQEMFRCDDFDRDGNYCEPVSGFRDNDDIATHATFVSSTVLADYTQGQGEAYALGDGSWTAASGHSAQWRDDNTGIAREARLIFFGQMADNDSDDGTQTSSGLADAFDDSIDRSVDITNSSWGWNSDGSSSCSLLAVAPHELEAENAFDDGILMVVSSGNPNTGVCNSDRNTTCNVNSDCVGTGPCIASTGTCNIGSPADLPKTLAINALNAAEPGCQSGYLNCLTDVNFSANGGINATVNGNTCTGCVAGNSLTTLNRFCGATTPGGLQGSAGACFAGTSAAAPVVAGAAALVKDHYLSTGQNFINNPGRLHTVMLGMGDRHNHNFGQASSQLTVGVSRLMGTGRLKMRLFENGAGMGPWGNNVSVWNFVSGSGDVVYTPWNTPIPAGAEVLKCVSYQVEDMSAKADISQIELEVRLRQPVSGQCGDPAGPVYATLIDAGAEIVHMAAFENDSIPLANACVEVTLENFHTTAAGVTAITQCYYAGVDDDASAPELRSFLAVAALIVVTGTAEAVDSDCRIATLADVEIRVSDATELRALLQPPPSSEMAARLAVDAAVAQLDLNGWLAPSSSKARLQSWREWLATMESEQGTASPGPEAAARLRSVGAAWQLRPGPCFAGAPPESAGTPTAKPPRLVSGLQSGILAESNRTAPVVRAVQLFVPGATGDAVDRLRNVLDRSGGDLAVAVGLLTEEGLAARREELGRIAPHQVDRAFAEAVFAAQAGERVGPLVTRFGLHVVAVVERWEPGSIRGAAPENR